VALARDLGHAPGRHGASRLSAVGGSPAYAPDGRSVVFASNRDGNQELYALPAGGGTPVQLTNTPGVTEASPAWGR